MKVVKDLEQDQFKDGKEEQQKSDTSTGFIRMKKFHFMMLLFLLVFLTAGITTFALAFGGDEKVVKVSTERKEFEKLYSAFDTLKTEYYKDIK